MKNILFFISFCFMFLLSVKSMDNTSLEKEEVRMEYVLQEDVPTEYVLSVVAELPEEGEAYVDAESLARQFRVCGRGQRSLSVQYVLNGKGMVYRMAKKHIDILYHSINRIYTSLPCQSWSVPSLHYVFGMRHILI